MSQLQTQLEAAEHKPKALRHMAESALTEVKRDHGEAGQLFRAQVSEPENRFQSPSESAWAEDSCGSCLLSEEDPTSETEELVADKWSVILQGVGQQPGKLQAFIAPYSYGPFDGPGEQPELDLPLTAGQYDDVFGPVDEDGWSVGKLSDGTRRFIPSTCTEKHSDDDLENENWDDPCYYIFGLSPIFGSG